MLIILLLSQPLRFVINPLPRLLLHGEYMFSMRYEPNGFLAGKVGFGLWDIFEVNVGYGGDDVIGYGEVRWAEQPWVDVKAYMEYAGFDIVVGFDSERYDELNAFGLYGCGGKEIPLIIGDSYLSFGINYNPEINGMDFFSGFYLHIGETHYLFLDYRFGANEEDKHYLNFGFFEYIGPLGVEFDLINIFGNSPYKGPLGRQLKVFYRERF